MRQLRDRREASGIQLWGVADGEPEGARGGFFMAGRDYTGTDCAAVVVWLADRATGYPSLTQFEHGADWPYFPSSPDKMKCSGCQGATWGHRTYPR
jgi:hypothetical protein